MGPKNWVLDTALPFNLHQEKREKISQANIAKCLLASIEFKWQALMCLSYYFMYIFRIIIFLKVDLGRPWETYATFQHFTQWGWMVSRQEFASG